MTTLQERAQNIRRAITALQTFLGTSTSAEELDLSGQNILSVDLLRLAHLHTLYKLLDDLKGQNDGLTTLLHEEGRAERARNMAEYGSLAAYLEAQ